MAIFGKAPDAKPVPGTPVPSPSPTPSQGASGAASAGPLRRGPEHAVCVIGPQVTIKGEITGEEDILVEGTVEGLVRISRELRVGEKGTVKATIEAQSILIHGEVVGDCHATTRVEIQTTGRLTGDIRAPKIVIAEGAMFRGNSDMTGKRETKPGGTAS